MKKKPKPISGPKTWKRNTEAASESRRLEKPIIYINVGIFEEQNDWLELMAKQSTPGMEKKLSKAELVRMGIDLLRKQYFIV